MKATKKQIAEITAVANQMGVKAESALATLNNVSASIYKVIGAKGVVETCVESAAKVKAAHIGGFLFTNSDVLSSSEKALLISINTGVKVVEKWIAKSIILNGNTVPFWAVK
jgi:prefoldin subunit 5